MGRQGWVGIYVRGEVGGALIRDRRRVNAILNIQRDLGGPRRRVALDPFVAVPAHSLHRRAIIRRSHEAAILLAEREHLEGV